MTAAGEAAAAGRSAAAGEAAPEGLALPLIVVLSGGPSAEHDVSISTVRQEGRGDDAQLVVVSHSASDADLSATVESIRRMAFVRDVSSVMRVEGASE